MNSEVHYLPLTPGLFSILVILLVGLLILIQLRILRYAYMRLGVGPGAALLLLFTGCCNSCQKKNQAARNHEQIQVARSQSPARRAGKQFANFEQCVQSRKQFHRED